MKSLNYKKIIVTAIIAIASINNTHAAAIDFIDHSTYTTDTVSGLDWLDVTTSVNQSYNYVSSQFGANGIYAGWRYATGNEFNQLVTNYTGIASQGYNRTSISGNRIDGLVSLLGSTLDSYYNHYYGRTYDSWRGRAEGEWLDYTYGLISDAYYGSTYNWLAIMVDDSRIYSRYRGYDYTDSHYGRIGKYYSHYHIGSYLVRDNNMTATPVPAAVWLMASGLLGIMGLSRKNSPVAA